MAYKPESFSTRKKADLNKGAINDTNANRKVRDIEALAEITGINTEKTIELDETKQETLKSGENIITINEESILEGKNLDLSTKCFTIAMSIAL